MFEGAKQWGSDGASAGTLDILGRARRMIGGVIDVGPYAFSRVALDYANEKTVEPAVTILQKGQSRFTFWAKGGESFTKTVWVKFSNATTKPSVRVIGQYLSEQTATATGDGTAYEQLSVSGTPSADGEVVLYLCANDTGASASVTFSDMG
jgi:hypothetical protein